MLHLPKMALPPLKKRERDNTKGYKRDNGCFFPFHQVNWLCSVSRGDAGYPTSAYQIEASYHMLCKVGKKRGEQPWVLGREIQRITPEHLERRAA